MAATEDMDRETVGSLHNLRKRELQHEGSGSWRCHALWNMTQQIHLLGKQACRRWMHELEQVEMRMKGAMRGQTGILGI